MSVCDRTYADIDVDDGIAFERHVRAVTAVKYGQNAPCVLDVTAGTGPGHVLNYPTASYSMLIGDVQSMLPVQ